MQNDHPGWHGTTILSVRKGGEVVIAGDMTSMLPLVHRLHAAGVRVVVVGPAHTPHDVRAACDDFIDVELLAVERPVVAGRHRA